MISIRILLAVLMFLNYFFKLIAKLLFYWARVAIFFGVLGLIVCILMGDSLDEPIITLTLGVLLPCIAVFIRDSTKTMIQKLDRYLTKSNQGDNLENNCNGDL